MRRLMWTLVYTTAALGLIFSHVETGNYSDVASPQVLAASDTRPILPTPRPDFELNVLRSSDELTRLANSRALDMVQHQYYAHQNPNGFTYADQLNSDTFSCENLLLEVDLPTAAVYQKWLESESHRDCLLHTDITEAGYAKQYFSSVAGDSSVDEYYIYVFIAR